MKPLLWCDVETTGLDERKGKLLEVAFVMTNEKLEEIGATSLVIHHKPETLDPLMDDYVRQMHTDNGLLEAVQAVSTDVERVEQGLLWQLLHWRECWYPLPLAGSCPSFDRLWLEAHMPMLARLPTHQHFDMSTFRFMWDLPKPDKGGMRHRALADIRADITQLREIHARVGDEVWVPSVEEEAERAYTGHPTAMGGLTTIGDKEAFILGFKAARGK